MLPCIAKAQKNDGEIGHTLYFVGDAGEPDIINQPLGNALRKKVEQSGPNTTVIYLGDNIYPKGMPDENTRGRELAEQIIGTQTQWIRGLDAKGIFIPGNHDWQRGKKRGYSYLKNQQQWVDSLNTENIIFLPRDGCPGPIEVPLTDQSALVILDTQWPLHPWDKPETDSDCEAKTPADLWALLGDVFNRNKGKRIILAGHHPLISYGEHGGIFKFKDHIFPLTSLKSKLYIPLPIVGSIYPLYRKWFGNIQDISHTQYKDMSAVLRKLMADYPGTIYTSGHEHALQYIEKDSTHFIVSGSGSKTTFVKKKKFSLYAGSVTGFVKLVVYKDGSAKIEFWRVDQNFPEGIKTFEIDLPLYPPKAAIPCLERHVYSHCQSKSKHSLSLLQG